MPFSKELWTTFKLGIVLSLLNPFGWRFLLFCFQTGGKWHPRTGTEVGLESDRTTMSLLEDHLVRYYTSQLDKSGVSLLPI